MADLEKLRDELLALRTDEKLEVAANLWKHGKKKTAIVITERALLEMRLAEVKP